MKKIFTLMLALMSATGMMAQMHGALKFAGASNVSVLTTSIDNASDTIQFAMSGATTGDITLPEMKGMATIPSFTIKDAKFSMGDNHVVTFDEQSFSATVTVDGAEKKVTGASLTGTYNMADNSLTLKAVFQYGAMPLPTTFTIKAYYVKPVTNAINVSVAGIYNYENDNVTYNVRKYMDGDVEKVDVEVPSYTLEGTVMGDLTLGSYIVKGLTYDATRGGFYRDYRSDGLSFHFTAEQNGSKTMDGDYAFNSEKDNSILVVYEGSQVASIENHFQMGAMPFPIVSTFSSTSTSISLPFSAPKTIGNGKAYNLRGQQVGSSAKGIVIINGKKYLKK